MVEKEGDKRQFICIVISAEYRGPERCVGFELE